MALQVETRALETLIPYARNSRTHSDAQVAQIAGSIREFGWTNPVLVDGEGGIIAGHGRVLAARQLGLREVPVITLAHLTPAQRRAYVIADNKLALNAGWDLEMLVAELGELRDEDFDLALTGFSDDELAALLAEKTEGLTDPDAAPELPADPLSRPGDLWLLGRHRLLCGDSTSADDVGRLLGEVRPTAMITDPPYGVEYDPKWRAEAGVNKNRKKMGAVKNDDRADWREAWALFPGDIAYVWHAGLHAGTVADSLVDCGFDLRSQIVWAKDRFALSRGDYHWQHEPCQPAGTLVSKVVKEGRWKETSVIEQVPIESLTVGDKVVSFGNAKIYRRGRKVTRIGSRRYSGNLHTIEVGKISTKTTAEHQFTVRFDPEKANSYLLYLMRRGNWWRLGVCGMFNSRGFGLAVRLDQERGDEAWILSTHADRCSAVVAEQIASCSYAIPTTHWENDRQAIGTNARSIAQIGEIYNRVGVDNIENGAHQILMDNGRSREFPLITHDEVGRFSRRQSRIVRACNLTADIMQVPVPLDGEDFEWRPVTNNLFSEVSDLEVWSMDVDQNQHYVADGIVTHNCWYAVRAKASGKKWRGDRSQSTLWSIPARDDSGVGHGTQKPVECMRRPMVNSTSPGQAVYEPFCGSGTTIIAGEMEGRPVYAMELSPAYVDVIVRRWQDFTGLVAALEDGRTLADLEAESGGDVADTPV